jgi:hypothetical protein
VSLPHPAAADRGLELGSGPAILNQFLFVEHGSMTFAPRGEAPRVVRAGTLCAGLFGERNRATCPPASAAGYARGKPGV